MSSRVLDREIALLLVFNIKILNQRRNLIVTCLYESIKTICHGNKLFPLYLLPLIFLIYCDSVMVMFSIPKYTFYAVELLIMIFATFEIAVEKLFCPTAATNFIVVCHLINHCGSKHVSFSEIFLCYIILCFIILLTEMSS